MTASSSYMIVGAGVFGASTALHLARTLPNAKITLVDQQRPNQAAASSDLNKVIRADYDDIVYMQLGLEAQASWRNDPIFKPWYHESGLLMVEPRGVGRKVYENYKTLNCAHTGEMLTPEQVVRRFPVFQNSNWGGVKECLYNSKSGWGEGDEALGALVQAAIDHGVKFMMATVNQLHINGSGECLGVKIENGEGSPQVITADTTVLCTGASTAGILADSAPHWDELQANDRIFAVGAVQCTVSYPPEEQEKLENAPFLFLGYPHTEGEVIPAFKGLLKFNCDKSFTNFVYHKGLEKQLSLPPSKRTETVFSQDVPESLKKDVQRVVDNTYGRNIQGLVIQSYRMCWDAMSPNQDWIIDYHPSCKDLFIATAGSFHAWKFMPNIGKYVVQGLLGTLSNDLARKWAWDREPTGAACSHYIPEQDLKDF
ncbi:sarcosine oxidase [Xylariaceae sp. FL1651]|nr:sarcosine oxidase [Xylariaceae sp. FL1651]